MITLKAIGRMGKYLRISIANFNKIDSTSSIFDNDYLQLVWIMAKCFNNGLFNDLSTSWVI